MAYNNCKDINIFQAVVFKINCLADVGYLHDNTRLIFKNLQINISSVDTWREIILIIKAKNIQYFSSLFW